MDRRGFLKLLGMAAPVAAVSPKYFFAPVGGWKSDVIVNPRLSEAAVTAVELEALSSGLYGLQYWQTSSNTSVWAEISRSSYPGRLRA